MKASINVEEGALELMSKGNLDEPVIMLNLLKYLVIWIKILRKLTSNLKLIKGFSRTKIVGRKTWDTTYL